MSICANRRTNARGSAAALALMLGLVVVAMAERATAQTPSGGPAVVMAATRPADYGLRSFAVDKLAERSVLDVTIIGFEEDSTGVIEQCSVGGCANPFPVSFDFNGRARIQYLVRDDFASGFETPSTCRAGQPACVVRVHSDEHFAYLSTVFHGPASLPPTVTVAGSPANIVDGTRVQVLATGFTPGDRVQAMFCVALDTFGSKHCGRPGPVAPFTIGPDGTGSTTLAVREGHVGSEGASCGSASRCAVVVTHPRSAVPEAFVAVEFSNGPAAQYDVTRSIAGLGLAAALLALACFLVRRTDWRKPTEAETPELDDADLTGAME
jgi:hypothetical protein